MDSPSLARILMNERRADLTAAAERRNRTSATRPTQGRPRR